MKAAHVASLAVLLGLALGCPGPGHHEPHGHALADRFGDQDPQLILPSADRLNDELEAAPFVDQVVAAPAGFAVQRREHQLRRFPCAGCHPIKSDPERPVTHREIEFRHGRAEGMTCATCHDGEKPELLIDLIGEPVVIDQAYRQCARCHQGQADDWAGGAHGKRLATWAGERIVANCTDCHDPHAPAFPSRRPAITLMTYERDERSQEAHR